MNTIKFSVIIPLFNKERYIQRAITSVLNQSYSSFELLIIDDGSTDGSACIAASFQDPRIKLIRQINSGECAARNRGIQEAKENFIAFLDADDAWKPNFLAEICCLIQKFSSAGAYACAYEKIGRTSKKARRRIIGFPANQTRGIIPNFLKSIASGDLPVTSSSVCIRREVFNELGGFPQNVPRSGDIDTWLKISFRYPIAYSSAVCAEYYRDVENSSANIYLPGEEIPFKKTLLAGIQNGNIPANSTKYAVILLSKTAYSYALDALFAQNKPLAKKWYREINPIQLKLMLRKIIVFILLKSPYFLSRFYLVKFENRKNIKKIVV